MQVNVKPKVFFSCFFLQMAAKSSSLSHVSFLESMMRTKSTRALSFSFYQHFCRAEWPAETEVFEDGVESFSVDLSMTEDEAEDVVYLES